MRLADIIHYVNCKDSPLGVALCVEPVCKFIYALILGLSSEERSDDIGSINPLIDHVGNTLIVDFDQKTVQGLKSFRECVPGIQHEEQSVLKEIGCLAVRYTVLYILLRLCLEFPEFIKYIRRKLLNRVLIVLLEDIAVAAELLQSPALRILQPVHRKNIVPAVPILSDRDRTAKFFLPQIGKIFRHQSERRSGRDILFKYIPPVHSIPVAHRCCPVLAVTEQDLMPAQVCLIAAKNVHVVVLLGDDPESKYLKG